MDKVFIPLVMILVGYILKKHPVANMNNTLASRKSQEHWNYVQSIVLDIFVDIYKISVVVKK